VTQKSKSLKEKKKMVATRIKTKEKVVILTSKTSTVDDEQQSGPSNNNSPKKKDNLTGKHVGGGKDMAMLKRVKGAQARKKRRSKNAKTRGPFAVC
jgi:hypothetical protein